MTEYQNKKAVTTVTALIFYQAQGAGECTIYKRSGSSIHLH